MGMFFKAKSGIVYLASKLDKSWCCSERVEHVPVGIGLWHEKKVEELTKLHGKPPHDLEYGGIRD